MSKTNKSIVSKFGLVKSDSNEITLGGTLHVNVKGSRLYSLPENSSTNQDDSAPILIFMVPKRQKIANGGAVNMTFSNESDRKAEINLKYGGKPDELIKIGPYETIVLNRVFGFVEKERIATEDKYYKLPIDYLENTHNKIGLFELELQYEKKSEALERAKMNAFSSDTAVEALQYYHKKERNIDTTYTYQEKDDGYVEAFVRVYPKSGRPFYATASANTKEAAKRIAALSALNILSHNEKYDFPDSFYDPRLINVNRSSSRQVTLIRPEPSQKRNHRDLDLEKVVAGLQYYYQTVFKRLPSLDYKKNADGSTKVTFILESKKNPPKIFKEVGATKIEARKKVAIKATEYLEGNDEFVFPDVFYKEPDTSIERKTITPQSFVGNSGETYKIDFRVIFSNYDFDLEDKQIPQDPSNLQVLVTNGESAESLIPNADFVSSDLRVIAGKLVTDFPPF